MKTNLSILGAILLLAIAGSPGALAAPGGSGSGGSRSGGAAAATAKSATSTGTTRATTTARPAATPAPGAKTGFTDAISKGQQAHRSFQQHMNETKRRTEVRMSELATQRGARPDAVTRNGRPVELKPDSPSGQQAMARQLRRYEDVMAKRGVRAFYDAQGSRRIERTPYSEWRSRPEVKTLRRVR